MVAILQNGGEWSAGHAAGEGWLWWLSILSATAFAALYLGLLVRAVRRGRRYLAVAELDETHRTQVAGAVAEAEKRTVGEIVPAVVERSDPHPQAGWIAGLATLVAGLGLGAGVLPWGSPLVLLACQVGLFLAGFLAADRLPDFRRLFISEERATATAQEQALQEFYSLGLHRTEAQTGVLLFVSLLERRVIVLGDAGIDGVVTAAHWEQVDDAILAGVRAGDLGGGLIRGVELCGDVLAEHFPWEEGDRNEVPDRVVVRRE
ncbi:MAG: TPM domain-containing protein [Planctomycetota bacterium]